MEKATLDILGPLPVSHSTIRFILIISDCFMKGTEFVSMPDQEAPTLATAFVNNFMTRFVTPLLVLTDGRNNSILQTFPRSVQMSTYLKRLNPAMRS